MTLAKAAAGGAENNGGGQQQQQQQENNGGQNNDDQQQQQQQENNGGQNNGGQQQQQQQNELPAWMPKDLPEHLRGQSEAETLAKVHDAYKGARTELGSREAPAKKAEDLKFTPSEKIAAFAPDLERDGLFVKVKDHAIAAGMTPTAFDKFLNGVLGEMVDGGQVNGVDYSKEILALVPEEAKTLDEKGQKAAVSQRVNNNIAWLEGAKKQGLDPEIADFLTATLADRAIGNRAVEWMRSQMKAIQPAMGSGGGSGMGDADLDARLKDPRGDPRSSTFDRNFATETDRLYQKKYG